MNREEWLGDFLWTIDALEKFGPYTHIPAPMPHRLLGSAIEDTRCFLTIPTRLLVELIQNAPTLDDPVQEADLENYMINRLQAVHRTFYVGMYSAVEAGLRYICDEEGWEAKPQRKRQMRSITGRIRAKVDATPIEGELQELEQRTQQYPALQDFLYEILHRKELEQETIDGAKRYFPLLGIFRNKCSHSGSAALTPSEIKRLRAANMSGFVTPDGYLSFSTRAYPLVAQFMLNILNRVYAAPNKPDAPETVAT